MVLIEDIQSSDGFKYIGQCPDINALRQIVGTVNQKILLNEYQAGEETGGGELFWLNSPSLIDDSVTFFRVNSSGGWSRDLSSGIQGLWAGNILSGDATQKLNLLSTAAANRKSSITLPNGTIKVSGTWVINQGDDLFITGQGMGNTHLYFDATTNDPGIVVKKSDYDSHKTRTRNFTLRDLTLSGSASDVSSTTWSKRDLMHLYGVGFDFHVSNVWFYRFGRRAVYAVDLWDGDFLNCKIQSGGNDSSWTETVYQHALCFVRDADNCNAVRITHCHFEDLQRGAIKSQDFNHSFFLMNNKFESCNSSNVFPAVHVIDVADSFRNFVMFGGLCVLDQWAAHKHFIRISNDASYLSGVRFTSPSRGDGAACIDVIAGEYQTGASINCHFDVRGDLSDGNAQVVYPIKAAGMTDFSTSTVKLFNPGATFELQGQRNDISSVKVFTLGVNGSQTFVYQADASNKVRGIEMSGAIDIDGLASFTNITSLFDAGDVAILKNMTTSSLLPGTTVSASYLVPCDLAGNAAGSTPAGVWRAASFIPGMGVGLFERVR